MYMCYITFVFFLLSVLLIRFCLQFSFTAANTVFKIIRCEGIGDVYRWSEMRNDCLEVGGRPNFKLLLKTVLYLNNLYFKNCLFLNKYNQISDKKRLKIHFFKSVS